MGGGVLALLIHCDFSSPFPGPTLQKASGRIQGNRSGADQVGNEYIHRSSWQGWLALVEHGEQGSRNRQAERRILRVAACKVNRIIPVLKD